MSFWTDERITRLRKLWLADEMSCGEIGALLGCTRNSVIGKINRLGLSNIKTGPSPRTRARISRSVTEYRQSKKREPRQTTKVQQLLATEPLPPPAETDIARVSFDDLDSAKHCRWPCAEMEGNTAKPIYCGDAKVVGLPYCDHHARRAYKPAAPALPMILSPPSQTTGTWSPTVRIVPGLTPADA